MMETGDGHQKVGTIADGNEMEMDSGQDSPGVLRLGMGMTHIESTGWGLTSGGLAHMIWTEDMT